MSQATFPAPYRQLLGRTGSDGYASFVDQSRPSQVLLGNKSGVDVVAYKEKISRGVEATGAYSLDAYEATNYPGSYSVNVQYIGSPVVYTDSCEGNLYPCSEFPHNFDASTELNSEALTRFYERLRAVKTEMHSLAILGEARQTLKMLKKPFGNIVDLTASTFRILKNRKDRVYKLRRHLRETEWSKVISGTYLEWVFGIMPTVLDIKSGLDTLDRFKDNTTRYRIIGRAKRSSSYVSPSEPHVLSGGLAIVSKNDYSIHTEQNIQYLGYLDVNEQVALTSLNRARQLSGFTLEEFVPSLWEIMPWSWLIDYFTNMGDLLSAGTTDTGLVKFVVKTSKLQSSRIGTGVAVDPAPYWTGSAIISNMSGDFGHTVNRRTTLVREAVPVSALSIPSLTFTHPGDSWKKLTNMLAVANSLRSDSRDLAWLSRRGH